MQRGRKGLLVKTVTTETEVRVLGSALRAVGFLAGCRLKSDAHPTERSGAVGLGVLFIEPASSRRLRGDVTDLMHQSSARGHAAGFRAGMVQGTWSQGLM